MHRKLCQCTGSVYSLAQSSVPAMVAMVPVMVPAMVAMVPVLVPAMVAMVPVMVPAIGAMVPLMVPAMVVDQSYNRRPPGALFREGGVSLLIGLNNYS